MEIFEKAYIGSCELSNRIIRSATFEGMANKEGIPTEDYVSLYKKLSQNNIGAIITGFVFISKEGKAMQPGQAGINSVDYIPVYKRITDEVHRNNGKIFLQLAHTGRQTRKKDTGEEVVGVSGKKSIYFKSKTRVLSTKEIYQIIEKFGDSANYARQAGFDGIQIHAAHGYLIHQFMLPHLNMRKDIFGIEKGKKIGTKFLDLVINNIRQKCGEEFPILVKVSGSDDFRRKFTKAQFTNLIKFLDSKTVDAIEVSYGTMDYAMNIFRGDVPVDLILAKNDIYRTDNKFRKKFLKTLYFPIVKTKFFGFSPMYNLNFARLAKRNTNIPIITVGGFREKKEIEYAIQKENIDFVSLCRAIICEPDFVNKLMANNNYRSKCVNCNYCAIMCDTENVTKCYKHG